MQLGKFFGALFIFAAVIYLYKIGFVLPDLKTAFGDARVSYTQPATYAYQPTQYTQYPQYPYTQYTQSQNPQYGGFYMSPQWPNDPYIPTNPYRDNMFICYGNSAPVVPGMNFNAPRICTYSSGGYPTQTPVYPTTYPSGYSYTPTPAPVQTAYYQTPTYYPNYTSYNTVPATYTPPKTCTR